MDISRLLYAATNADYCMQTIRVWFTLEAPCKPSRNMSVPGYAYYTTGVTITITPVKIDENCTHQMRIDDGY